MRASGQELRGQCGDHNSCDYPHYPHGARCHPDLTLTIHDGLVLLILILALLLLLIIGELSEIMRIKSHELMILNYNLEGNI